MNPELKKQWTEALRSGKYRQGTQRLRTVSDAYCCLGVLCDVVDAKAWRLAVAVSSGREGCYLYEGTSGELSSRILNLASLPYAEMAKLTTMNDSEGKSFDEIADYIDKEL